MIRRHRRVDTWSTLGRHFMFMCGRHLVDDTWGRHLVDTYKYWYGSLSMKDTYVPQTRVLLLSTMYILAICFSKIRCNKVGSLQKGSITLDETVCCLCLWARSGHIIRMFKYIGWSYIILKMLRCDQSTYYAYILSLPISSQEKYSWLHDTTSYYSSSSCF